jgi:hypothetical protein
MSSGRPACHADNALRSGHTFCTLCFGTEAAGRARSTGAAADEYNLTVVDRNTSVTVPVTAFFEVQIRVFWGERPGTPGIVK